jgi:hypothetical protein
MAKIKKHLKHLAYDIFYENRKAIDILIKESSKISGRYISIPVNKDGVFDLITYDRETGFFYVDLSVGVGKGMGDGFSINAAYFDKTKIIRIKVGKNLNI